MITQSYEKNLHKSKNNEIFTIRSIRRECTVVGRDRGISRRRRRGCVVIKVYDTGVIWLYLILQPILLLLSLHITTKRHTCPDYISAKRIEV